LEGGRVAVGVIGKSGCMGVTTAGAGSRVGVDPTMASRPGLI